MAKLSFVFSANRAVTALFAHLMIGVALPAQVDSVPQPFLPLLHAVENLAPKHVSVARRGMPLRTYRLSQSFTIDRSERIASNVDAVARAFPTALKRAPVLIAAADALFTGCSNVREVTSCIATQDLLVVSKPEMSIHKDQLQVVIDVYTATRGQSPRYAATYFANVVQTPAGDWALIEGSLRAIASAR